MRIINKNTLLRQKIIIELMSKNFNNICLKCVKNEENIDLYHIHQTNNRYTILFDFIVIAVIYIYCSIHSYCS